MKEKRRGVKGRKNKQRKGRRDERGKERIVHFTLALIWATLLSHLHSWSLVLITFK
jgi:hypothetical protein